VLEVKEERLVEEEPKKESTEGPAEDQKPDDQTLDRPSFNTEAAPEANKTDPTAQTESVPPWLKVNKAWEGAESYPIRMQLPKAGETSPRTAEFAADSATITEAQEEYLLPKPELDFEQFPGLEEPRTRLLSGKARKSLSGPIGVLLATVLLLIAAGIGSYRLGWLSGFGRKNLGKENSPTADTSAAEASAVAPVASPEGATPVATREHVAGPGKEPIATKNTPIESAGNLERLGGSAASPKRELAASAGRENTRKSPATKATGEDVPVGPAPTEDVYVPPKLVKAVRSLSPPEALQTYASGVVTLNALVDEMGRVRSATPISGPKALYEKAVDTVKEYVYQPATKNGKPVQANVEVKIQFWYEP